MSKLYITFFTTAEVIATELACREYDLQGKLVPVPRVLSAGCGIAWEGIPAQRKELIAMLQAEDIEYEEIAEL